MDQTVQPVLNPKTLSEKYKNLSEEEEAALAKEVEIAEAEKIEAAFDEVSPTEAIQGLLWRMDHTFYRYGVEIAAVFKRKDDNDGSRLLEYKVGGGMYNVKFTYYLLIIYRQIRIHEYEANDARSTRRFRF